MYRKYIVFFISYAMIVLTLGMFLASTLVMKLIDACRERIFSRKSNLHILVANDETYALAA